MNNQQKENVIKILGYLSEANVVLEKLEEKRSREPSNLGLQMAGEENWKKLFQLGCIIPLMSTTWKKGRKKWLKYRLSYYRPLEAGAYLYDLMNKRGHGSYSRYMTVIKDYNGIRRTVNAKKILRSFFFEPIPDFPEYEFAESLNLKKCKGAEQWENEIRDIADFIGTVHIEPDIAYMCDTDELNMDIKTTIGNVADYIENNRDSFSFSNGIERKRWLEFADIYSEKVINKLNKNFKRDEYVYSIFNPRVYSWIRNRRKKEIKISATQKVYERWKIMWKDEFYDEETDLFYPLFIETYDYVIKKEKENKDKNFDYKKKMVVWSALVVTVGAFILNVVANADTKFFDKKYDFLKKIINIARIVMKTAKQWGGFSIILIFIFGIIGFWYGVNKYQETWVRHSAHKHRLDRELLLYTQGLEPYIYKKTRKRLFADNIIKIWDGNQNKFESNMKKEYSIGNLFEIIKDKNA